MPVFLTPLGGLVALAAVLPLGAAWMRERRQRSVRGSLGLESPARLDALASALPAAVAVALLGLAAAQPAVAHSTGARARTDAAGYLVLDDTRSMAAVRRPAGPSRLVRAKAIALRLRDGVPELPWGVASVNDRTLVHSFPSTDRGLVADTLAQAIGIQRPPPTFTEPNATSFEALRETGGNGFFRSAARKRVVVLFTDGESRAFAVSALLKGLAAAHVRLVVVRLWSARDRVYDRHGRDLGYRPDRSSAALLRELAAQGAPVVDERDAARLPAVVRRAIGAGPTDALPAARRLTPLAPEAVLAACLALGAAFLRTRRPVTGALRARAPG